jgi:hypothetical protein
MMAPRDQKQKDLASLMYPQLSREARQQAAEKQRVQAEQRERSKQTAENLQEVIDSLRRERGR